MADLTLTFNGMDKTVAHFGSLDRKMEEAAKIGLVKSGAMLAIHMKSLQGRRPYPLRQTQTLWKSIDFIQEQQGWAVRVGPGGLAGKYAPGLEFGNTIIQTVTPKQQRYLAAAKGIFVRAGQTLRITIPKYSYVQPTWDQRGHDAIDTISREIGKVV